MIYSFKKVFVFAVYGGAGTISTMQSTLDSSQFGGNTSGGGGAVMGLDATTDNNSSHDGSEENNDLLPPLPTSASVPPSHAHWNLVPPQYTGYTPANMNVAGATAPPNAQAARYGASTPLPMYPQSSTDYLVNGAPSHMSYSECSISLIVFPHFPQFRPHLILAI